MKARHDIWPIEYTANGVQIVPGLRVLDADQRETVVLDRCPYCDGETTWFYTANGGVYDGSRLEALSRPDEWQRLHDLVEVAA